jgi:predicted MFS family arabinose efflux permease
MSGLLLGILLARTVASWVAAAAGWRTVYAAAAAATIVTALVLRRILPSRDPGGTARYRDLLRSMDALVREEPLLRRRAAVQMLFFGVFSAFWTTVAFELIAEHGLTQGEVGVFALVGAAGAGAAPVAGTLADRGYGRPARGAMAALGILALGLAGVGDASVARLAAAGFLLDVAVQGHQVLSQRDVYSLRPDARSRVNTIYMTVIFAGGALLTAASGALYEIAGWAAVTAFAASLLGVALVVWLVVPEPAGAPFGGGRVRSVRSARGRGPASPATTARPPSPRT